MADNKNNAPSALSVGFSTPLAGSARTERIKKMSNSHPAFERARYAQELLVNVQTRLRRMPGITSNDSQDLFDQLQEVGRVLSQETSQLVDALMSITLDQEDTDNAIARLSMEATLAKASSEGHIQANEALRNELAEEKRKRKEAESAVKETTRDFQSLSDDFKELQTKDESKETREELFKSMEDTIKHLEDQVNSRRSLWVMKHSDPQSVARAIETLAGSVPDPQAARNAFMQKAAVRPKVKIEEPEDRHRQSEGMPPPPPPAMNRRGPVVGPPARPASVFQPINRPPTAPVSKFSPLQAGPPRAPTAVPFDRRPNDLWGPGAPAQSRALANGNAFFQAQSSFGRPPLGRRGYPPNTGSRYRPTAPDFLPASGLTFQPDLQAGKNVGPYHPNARDGFQGYPVPPLPAGHPKYNRMPDSPSPNTEYAGSHHRTAVLSRSSSSTFGGPSMASPLIHLTEEAIATWNAQIVEFYQLIRGFVEHHASDPDSSAPLKLSTMKLWHVLLETYRPLTLSDATSYLSYHLRNENSKACLVTRVIIDYVVNCVWVPSAWAHSDTDPLFAHLARLESDLENSIGKPSAQRQALLDEQAAIIDSIMASENGPHFSRQKVAEITQVLESNLKPLFNKMADPPVLLADLEQVAENAWELSSKILTSRLTFDFRFPEIGSRFSCQSMLPIWPIMDPMELQAKHWRVALVTTPVITCRNDTGTNISAHSVTLADVICMQ